MKVNIRTTKYDILCLLIYNYYKLINPKIISFPQ
jgi:hypothetical protein